MPRFIGNKIPGATHLDNNDNAPHLVRLSYSQAMILHDDGEEICCSLGTDRGGPRTKAKRWYRWFASPEAIQRSPNATREMLAAARAHRIIIGNVHAPVGGELHVALEVAFAVLAGAAQ